MPAIIRSLLLSGEALNGEINARKSAAPKMEIPMVTIWPERSMFEHG